MIREKIFRLHRHKSTTGLVDASAEKIDFLFSNIKALQVPKGWDKLSLSLNSSETGKAVRKSGKGLVKNGTCQWTETLSESIWIAKADGSKNPEQYHFTFLVTMGSSRSGVLGQATLDLASFLSSEVPVSLSLPLQKCNFGTTLQVDVKCLTPRRNLSDRKCKSMHTRIDGNGHHEDVENKCEESDSMLTKSVESCSSDKFSTASRPRELGSQESGFSAFSFDSLDDSIGTQSFSSHGNLNGSNNAIVRQDSVDSHDSTSVCSYSTLDSPTSDRSLQNHTFREIHSRNQREEFRKLSQSTALSLQRDSGSVNDGTVQELKAEARMWEQNARKLRVDVESLNVEQAKSRLERQKLTQEIEHLKSLLEKESLKQNASGNSGVHGQARNDMQKELADELRFQKEMSESLSVQLNKTQESNIELISILQDMEETIENQKMEIESLSVLKSEHEDNSATNIDDEVPHVNKYNIELEMMNLQSDVLYLQRTLEEKIFVTEIEQDLKNQFLKEYEVEFISRLAAKEREIGKLEDAISRAMDSENLSNIRGGLDSSKEVKHLEKMVQELEANCNELTRQNQDDQTELMKHLSDLEEENDYLSQRISGLESQLRYLDETRESSRLELQQREFQVTALQSEIVRLEEEIESEKLHMNHKFSDVKKMWSEAQEECLNLSKVNIRLQATTESLIEEYDSLQKFNGELREQKSKLQDRCMVLEAQVRGFQDSLCNCSENIETLEVQYSFIKGGNIGTGKTAEEEKLLKLFANIMNNEEKRKGIIDELELNLKLSEVERLRLAEGNSILQMQVEKVPELQNEVLSLKLSLKEMETRYQSLETLFNSVSYDYEGLKSNRDSMFHKISDLQKTTADIENLQRKNVALEEKILRMEGDLIAGEALCSRGSEMKNELNQMKRANTELQDKLKHLEEAREELQWKVQTLEELKQFNFKQQPPQVFNKQDNWCQMSSNPEMDCWSRIQVLEKELVKTLEANELYKLQLQTGQQIVSEKPKSSQVIGSAIKEQKIKLLEEELQELRERYLEISLKYAEGEAEREQLLRKLKTLNGLGSFTQRWLK